MCKSVGKRIKKRRLALGWSADELGKRIGRDRATVYRYESDEIKNFPLDVMSPLAEVLGVSKAYLMGWEIDNGPIPVPGTIAAGKPILAEENIIDRFVIDTRIKADFALIVKGDSVVDAGIIPGDVAFIRKQNYLENGEIGAILIEDEATLKKFYKEGDTVVLQSENDAYKPMILTGGDVRVLGRLIATLSTNH